MTHNSKSLTHNLKTFIMENVTGHRTSFEVSDVKGDGTVFVRFRSSPVDSSSAMAQRFQTALERSYLPFARTDVNKFRLPLCNFR